MPIRRRKGAAYSEARLKDTPALRAAPERPASRAAQNRQNATGRGWKAVVRELLGPGEHARVLFKGFMRALPYDNALVRADCLLKARLTLDSIVYDGLAHQAGRDTAQGRELKSIALKAAALSAGLSIKLIDESTRFANSAYTNAEASRSPDERMDQFWERFRARALPEHVVVLAPNDDEFEAGGIDHDRGAGPQGGSTRRPTYSSDKDPAIGNDEDE